MQLACFDIQNSGIAGSFNSFTAKGGHATATIASVVTSSKRSNNNNIQVVLDSLKSPGNSLNTNTDELSDPKASAGSTASASNQNQPIDSTKYLRAEDAEHFMHAQIKSAVRDKWSFQQKAEVPLAEKLRSLVTILAVVIPLQCHYFPLICFICRPKNVSFVAIWPKNRNRTGR